MMDDLNDSRRRERHSDRSSRYILRTYPRSYIGHIPLHIYLEVADPLRSGESVSPGTPATVPSILEPDAGCTLSHTSIQADSDLTEHLDHSMLRRFIGIL